MRRDFVRVLRDGVDAHERWLGRDVSIAVGVWEPVWRDHTKEFFCAARNAAAQLPLVAVALWPPPARCLLGVAGRPLAHSRKMRNELIRQHGAHDVVDWPVNADFLGEGIDAFLESVLAKISCRKLILGAGQSLGRGDRGNPIAIAKAAKSHGVDLIELDKQRPAVRMADVRRLISQGRFREAEDLIGHRVGCHKDELDEFMAGWRPGVVSFDWFRSLPSNASKADGTVEIEVGVPLTDDIDGWLCPTISTASSA